MFSRFTPIVAAIASCLCYSTVLADDKSIFKPSTSCETIKGYDIKWATYGNDFGFNPKPQDKPNKISGFYQLRGHGDKLYAAFGGAFSGPVTKGALLIFDAASFSLERIIPLPFPSHALALNTDGSKAVVTHTHENAFSIIDIPSGSVRCRKPDTVIEDKEYAGRYVHFGDQDSFFINYNDFKGNSSAVVMKYSADGEHADSFMVRTTEKNISMPLLYRDGQLLTGSRGLKALDVKGGEVRALSTDNNSLNFYNYAPGPGKTLLGTNYSYDGEPNLFLFDLAHNAHSAIYSGRGSLEVAYIAESMQAISTNFESNSVTIAALSTNTTGFEAGQFVNILLDGQPATLHAKRSAKGTDVFVALKHWGDDNQTKAGLLHRISIAGTVQGINGIQAPGACMVTVFNMLDRSVSNPEPCQLLDPSASYKADIELLKNRMTEIEKHYQETEVKLVTAKSSLHQIQGENKISNTTFEHQDEIMKLERQLKDFSQAIYEIQIGLNVLDGIVQTK